MNRILIVSDQVKTASALVKNLQSRFTIDVAFTEIIALVKLEVYKYDVIVIRDCGDTTKTVNFIKSVRFLNYDMPVIWLTDNQEQDLIKTMEIIHTCSVLSENIQPADLNVMIQESIFIHQGQGPEHVPSRYEFVN